MQSTKLPQQTHSFLDSTVSVDSCSISSLITYPYNLPCNSEEYIKRIDEIYSLGIKSIQLGGRKKIGKTPIAGKGCVSVVVKTDIQNKIHALKIRRMDANRESMDKEVMFHKIANEAGVGPALVDYSKNFILMEFVDGLDIIDWIRQDNISQSQMRNVIINVLENAYNLDRAHLDHGELSCIDHHVIVAKSGNPTIIDFESSSIQRKTSNVTSAAQSLLLSGFVSSRVNSIIKIPSREKIIGYLKAYKWNQTKDNFENLLSTIC